MRSVCGYTLFASDKRTEKVSQRFVLQAEDRRQRDFRKSVWNLDENSTSFNNTCETLVMFVALYFAILKELTIYLCRISHCIPDGCYALLGF